MTLSLALALAGQIVDSVRVPAGLAPGQYVLGWRWDCEQTSQSKRTAPPPPVFGNPGDATTLS